MARDDGRFFLYQILNRSHRFPRPCSSCFSPRPYLLRVSCCLRKRTTNERFISRNRKKTDRCAWYFSNITYLFVSVLCLFSKRFLLHGFGTDKRLVYGKIYCQNLRQQPEKINKFVLNLFCYYFLSSCRPQVQSPLAYGEF